MKPTLLHNQRRKTYPMVCDKTAMGWIDALDPPQQERVA
jgi:hypothetical protein